MLVERVHFQILPQEALKFLKKVQGAVTVCVDMFIIYLFLAHCMHFLSPNISSMRAGTFLVLFISVFPVSRIVPGP